LIDWNPAVDQSLDDVEDDFRHATSMEYVPVGVAILKFATLLEALDWHVYATRKITLEDARGTIKWAAELMDEKFDLDFKKLPQ